MKTFLIQYLSANGEAGYHVLQAKDIEEVAPKCWMLKEAYIIELTPTNGWFYNNGALRTIKTKLKSVFDSLGQNYKHIDYHKKD